MIWAIHTYEQEAGAAGDAERVWLEFPEATRDDSGVLFFEVFVQSE